MSATPAPPTEASTAALAGPGRSRQRAPAFLLSTGLSYVAHAVYSYAMVVLARDSSGSDAAAGGIFLLIALPPIVFSLLAGALADSLVRQRFLWRMQSVLAVMTALPAGALLLDASRRPTIVALGVCAILYGLASCWITPVRLAFAADIAPGKRGEQLMIAVNVLQFVAMALGPVLAGFGATTFGWPLVFVSIALGSGASAIALASLRGVPQQLEQSRVGALRRIAAGFRHVAADAQQTSMMLTTALVGSSLFGPVQVALPALGKHYLGLGEQARGFLMTPLGIGFLIGAGLAGALAKLRNRRAVLMGSALVAGAALASVGSSTRILLVAPLVGLVGVGVGVAAALTTATLGSLARPELRGRVMAVFTWTLLTSSALGGAVAGLAASRFGVPHTLVGLGIAVGIEVALLWLLSPRAPTEVFAVVTAGSSTEQIE